MKVISLIISIGFMASSAQAVSVIEYLCQNSGLQRRVEVVHDNTPEEGPCKVNYTKDTEAPGETQTLWTAQYDGQFCERKANEFLKKLSDWGWSCNKKDTTTQ